MHYEDHSVVVLFRGDVLPGDVDPVKAECASIFYDAYVAARDDPIYVRFRQDHLDRYPDPATDVL